jgi:hypothetical protein
MTQRYDYIGAPWNLKTNTPIIELQVKGHLSSGSGNGGFSLRSVSLHLSRKFKIDVTI